MPESIMRHARSAMSDRDRDMSQFLSELHRRVEEAQSIEARLKEREAALSAREKQLAQEWEKRESAKLRELERRCDAVIERFEAQAHETIDRILAGTGQRKAAELAARRVAKVKRELREEFETTVVSTEDDARRGDIARPKLDEGARVRLKGLREPARVLRKLSGDRIEVQAGFMKMQVPLDDVLEVLPEAGAPASQLPKGVSFRPAPELAPLHQEVNVIGKHAQEAVEEVDAFLDRAVMATASRVRIVHGHGMGVLKKAIADLLSRHPHVARHYPAPQQEGGSGATIVELRD
jgi:DNA mismatch repair protein MutS2